jgi:hypothetical protein
VPSRSKRPIQPFNKDELGGFLIVRIAYFLMTTRSTFFETSNWGTTRGHKSSKIEFQNPEFMEERPAAYPPELARHCLSVKRRQKTASFPYPVQSVSPAALNAFAAAPGSQIYRYLALGSASPLDIL